MTLFGFIECDRLCDVIERLLLYAWENIFYHGMSITIVILNFFELQKSIERHKMLNVACV